MATNGDAENAEGLTGENSVRKFDRERGEVVTVQFHAPRERPKTDADLEAGDRLNLGEFNEAHALSISEARLIVEATETMRKKGNKKLRETESLSKMLTYMDAFSRFRTLTTLNQLETLMSGYPQLETFEKAQLVTLCPGDAEEAKILIPSLLHKMNDDDLRDLLDQIDQQRQFNED